MTSSRLYINLVPIWQKSLRRFEAAALTYYGKSLDQLNLAQLAMLAPVFPQRGPRLVTRLTGQSGRCADAMSYSARMRGQARFNYKANTKTQGSNQSPHRYLHAALTIPSPMWGSGYGNQAVTLRATICIRVAMKYTPPSTVQFAAGCNRCAATRDAKTMSRSHGYRCLRVVYDAELLNQITQCAKT